MLEILIATLFTSKCGPDIASASMITRSAPSNSGLAVTHSRDAVLSVISLSSTPMSTTMQVRRFQSQRLRHNNELPSNNGVQLGFMTISIESMSQGVGTTGAK